MNKKNIYSTIKRLFIFFIFSTTITCVIFILFLNVMDFSLKNIKTAFPLTLINLIFLTIIFYVLDEVRKMFFITRPIENINFGLERMMMGDFSIRISYGKNGENSNSFNKIIDGINGLAEELEEVESLRSDFISNVSHELKTPLSIIQNYATMLLSNELSTEQRNEYSNNIISQISRLSSLITNILRLNKLENQQIYPEKIKFNLTEQICLCLLTFETSWEEKKINIETSLDEDVYITEDKDLLSIVWSNLFSNAIKFTNENGSIFVSIKKYKDYVSVSVKDTGCGIDQETGKHIFDKFFQGDKSHYAEGNGLGLTLVKRVIDIVGGRITVESTLGEGSTFNVELNIKEE